MIVDANLLVYARNGDDPSHEAAKSWLEAALNGETRVGLPWSSLSAFLRIATSVRIFPDPLSPEQAWRQVEEWLDAPRAWVPEPSARFRAIVARLFGEHRPQGRLVPDVVLAALALDHGVELASTDGDFARFAGLRWINPLRG